MHMADALLAPAVAVTMYAVSGAALGTSGFKFRKEEKLSPEPTFKKLPTMAVMSAMVFAGQMINYTIPGTGSSGHLCGGFLLAALLGPWAGFLCMAAILAIQCLFFADGGLMALGANIWNMGFYGCFVGYYLLYKPIMEGRLFSKMKDGNRVKIILASVAGCVISLQLGAFSVTLETLLSGITDIPFGAFVGLMQPIHLAIGAVEGLISAAVLLFIYEARPEMLRCLKKEGEGKKARFSYKSTIITLVVATLVIGGGLSLFASSNPDGLEWSLFGNRDSGYSENLGLDEENYGNSDGLADAAQSVQDKTAFMPDYAFAGDEENPAGTTVAGIVGAAMVAVLAGGLYFIGRHNKKKNETK